MALYVSLRGEAEEELEYMEVSQIDCDSVVDNILASLRRPLQTRAIYMKRKFLHDYEYLGRHNNETIRAFCNRYRRTEKSLLAAGVDVSGMYDAEARGSRLLDRLRLTAEQQRLILVATGQSLSFDAVKDAAQMQFPEHRPTPATVHHREFDNHGGKGPDHSRDSSGKPSHKGGGGKDYRQPRPPKGGGKYQAKPFRTYVAEEAQDLDDDDPGDDLPEIPEGEEIDENQAEDEEEMIPDAGPDGDDNLESVMQEVAECLTVTARRLQGVTLGRKFSKGGKGKSIEQRKRTSHCAICGEKGGKPDSKKGAAPKKVLAVFHPSGIETQTSMQDPGPEETQEFGSYFTTFMTMFAGPLREVFLSKPGDFAGYAVLDTACQRRLCSSKWLEQHRQLLRQLKLDARTQPEHEGFQFGTGPVKTSSLHAYFPVCLDGNGNTCSLFGASVMEDDSDIPFLLSLGMIAKKLKAVLDFPRNKAYLGTFDVEVPLVKINGHVCISLHHFPPEHFKKWQALSSVLDQGEPDPEFVKLPGTTATHAGPVAAPFVVAGMAADAASDPHSRDAPAEVHVSNGAVGIAQEVLAVAPGPSTPKVDRRAHREPEQSLRTSTSHACEVRQQERELPEVHAVRNKVEMGARSVGRTALLTIATAVASLGSLWSAANLGDQAGAEGDFFDKQFFGRGELDFTEAEVRSMNLHKGAPSKTAPAAMSEEDMQLSEDRYQRGVAARRALVLAEEEEVEKAPSDYAWDLVDAELKYHDALPVYKDIYKHPKIDLCEVFAGEARLTNEANYYGIAALEPFGTKFGHDLRQPVIRNLKPLVLYVNWPRPEDEDFDSLCALGAWALKDVMHYKNVTKTTCHPGAYGQEDADGFPSAAECRWITNSPVLAEKLSRRLNEEQLHYKSAGIQTLARRRNPSRFQIKPHDVYAARPLNDPVAWGQILDELEARFANTHKKPFTLNATDPLQTALKNLVPWKLEKVQAAWTPESRRFPQDVPFTHRGAALRLNSGEFVLESEDMAQITYPKQRYVRPVRVALFFFGFPKEDPQATDKTAEDETPEPASTRPLHGFQTELWFEDAPKIVDKQLQYTLARLRVSMGHAPKAELIRMLAASGNLSRKVLLGLDCLRCGSCIRLQKPKPPPTSSVAPAFTGFFGEVLQADLVYIRLITGTAVPVLGMCCEATNYHCGKALSSRAPTEVLQVLMEIWYRPLGSRLELYVPQAAECPFDLEDLADTRVTYRNEASEQLPQDQWRDPLCHLDYDDPDQRTRFTSTTYTKGQDQAMESAAYTSPGFSPGVPETPPVSPAPGTPDWTALPPQQPVPVPVPEVLGEQTSEQEPHVQHHEHNEPDSTATAGTDLGNNLEPAASRDGGAISSAAGSGNVSPDNEALPLLPQKRPAAVLVSSFPLNFDLYDNGEFTLKDGSDHNDTPFRRTYYYQCYLNSTHRKDEMKAAGVDEHQDQEDASTDDEKLNQSNQRTHSRKELKQLDREIPWRQIVELPRAQYEEYLEAIRLECDTWMSWGGIQPVSKKEAKRILGDPKLFKRVMKARAAYRDKAKGVGPLRAKCRVVIIGCADPDIFSISRDSPTPTRLSEALLMTIATAGANRELGFTRDRWYLWASDAKSAFLQGTQDTSERAGPLYMLPPKDPLMEETNSFPADLYVITGFTRHGFDRCLYYFFSESKELLAVVIIHVDDFLATYSEKFPVEVLEKMFAWGSITKVTPQQPATYRGKEITMVENNGRYKYRVTQKVFTDSMDSGKIPRGRSQQPERLDTAEWGEFRSVSGSLQWLAGQTRPELGPLVSLSNQGQETTYKDLQRLYAAADYAKETSNHGLVYQDVPLNKYSVFVTYTDSSFANAGVKSQYGVCVFLTAPSVADRVEKASLVDWKSARSARVCRSTLAAEASAADEGSDRATFANLCLSELFTGEPAFKVHPQFLNLQVTDAKSLYDTVIAENPSVSDKRSLVNIRSVQQSVKPQDFRWVPTSLMLADALTKLDWKLCCQFSELLQNVTLQLTEQGSKENKTSVRFQLQSGEP
ncbi:hypothetical protein AK812_SmicGene20463 [Symbiodinium microadriaticum]|uniref:Copia protein n=1 Tax=Symbiodinium microadriaticum TaxID=2951 RepID=A0A1Q9DPX3_SYMMI|nr:hypothetical protein AK812_SmicGene20463 [Symbiodinium microadriaticum]